MTWRWVARLVLSLPLAGSVATFAWMLFAVGYEYSDREWLDIMRSILFAVAFAVPLLGLLLFVRWPLWLLAPAALLSCLVLLWLFGVPPVATCYTEGWRIVCP